PHQRSGQHVVQSLLALSEPDHDVADAQEHSRKPLREMPSGGAHERDAVAVKISDLHPENDLAERRLVGGAQHESFVEPGAEEHQHQHDTTTEQMQAQTEWKATRNSRQPAQTRIILTGHATARTMIASMMKATTRIQNPPYPTAAALTDV